MLGVEAPGAPFSLLPQSKIRYVSVVEEVLGVEEDKVTGVRLFTVRNVETGIYLGNDSAQTEPAMELRGVTTPFAWNIERGPEPETFILSPSGSNGQMQLAPSPLRIYPPRVAWLPPEMGGYAFWRLVKV